MARLKKTGYGIKSCGTSEKDGVRVENGTSVFKSRYELKSRGTSCLRVRAARSRAIGTSIKAGVTDRRRQV